MTLGVDRSKKLFAYLCIIPAIIYMAVFCLYPIGYNIVLGFQDLEISNFAAKTYKFVGFKQYGDLLFGEHSELFFIGLKNTLIYTILSIIFQFILGFAFALFFAKKFKTAKFLRGIMLVAWLLPSTVVGLLMKFLFSEQSGIINSALMAVGIIDQPIAWLVEPVSAMAALIIANIWIGTPFNMLLLATGLSTLPEEIYESADVEGANRYQKFCMITLPLMKPTIISVLTLGLIRTFKVFDLVYIGTGGGPVNATEVLASVSYRFAFTSGNFSLGAAAANMLLLILFIFSLISLRLSRHEEDMY